MRTGGLRAVLRQTWPDCGLVVAFVVALCWRVPLATAFQFGADEGYELMKGLLCSHGYSLYSEVWNDQPPLHTILLSGVFRLFGPTALAGRLLTVAFSSLLIAALSFVVRKQAGRLGALFAVLLLIASPHFVQLSVSTMIELPAMALAVAAAAAWFRYPETGHVRWLIISGILIGCALQTKFTAAIFLPSFFVDAATRWRPERTGAREFGIWAAVGAVTFAAIGWFSGESFGVFWKSHFAGANPAALAEANQYRFKPGSLLDTPELVIAGVVGVCVAIRRTKLLFPVVLAGTVLTIHLVHHPYWYYYELHFAIALAWLASIGFGRLFSWLWKCDWAEFKRPPFRPAFGLLAWSAVTSLVLVEAPLKLKNALEMISWAENASDNGIVQWMRSHHGKSPWVFTDRVIYAFHAGLLVPPEVAVIPAKRRWSEQLQSADVIEALRRYRPGEVVLLGEKNWPPEVRKFLHENYLLDRTDSAELYTRRSEAK